MRALAAWARAAQRRPWQRELIAGVLARRPGALVIGTGTTHDAALAAGGYVGTRGSGRANLEAAADVLLGGS